MQKTFYITASEGIHARPAALLVHAAASFTSELLITYEEQEANLKSILSIMALSIPTQATIQLSATGDDAEQALTFMEHFFDEQGLGVICENL